MAPNATRFGRTTWVASAARTVSGDSGAIGAEDYDVLAALVNVTASGGTTPTLDIRLQTTYDGGTTWTDIAVIDDQISGVTKKVIASSLPIATSAAQGSFPSVDGTLAVGTLAKAVPLGDEIRFKWTIGGVTPSFTFSISGVGRRI